MQWVFQKDPLLKELLTFEHHKKSAVGVLSALFFVSCGTARPPKWFELNHENALSDRNCINSFNFISTLLRSSLVSSYNVKQGVQTYKICTFVSVFPLFYHRNSNMFELLIADGKERATSPNI